MFEVYIRYSYEDGNWDWQFEEFRYGTYDKEEYAEKVAEEIRRFKYLNPLFASEYLSSEVSIERIDEVYILKTKVDNSPFMPEMFCNKDTLPPHRVSEGFGGLWLDEDFIEKYNKKNEQKENGNDN